MCVIIYNLHEFSRLVALSPRKDFWVFRAEIVPGMSKTSAPSEDFSNKTHLSEASFTLW